MLLDRSSSAVQQALARRFLAELHRQPPRASRLAGRCAREIARRLPRGLPRCVIWSTFPSTRSPFEWTALRGRAELWTRTMLSLKRLLEESS